MAETGLDFEAIAGDYEEDMTLPFLPRELVTKLSHGKAECVAKKYPEAVVIGGDTIVAFKDKVLGKPHTEERARQMLHMLRGEKNLILTGLTVMCLEEGKTISRIVESGIYFKDLTDQEIEDYIKTGEPLDKAGAYAAQGLGGNLVRRMDGEMSAIMGLPKKELLEILENDFGIMP